MGARSLKVEASRDKTDSAIAMTSPQKTWAVPSGFQTIAASVSNRRLRQLRGWALPPAGLQPQGPLFFKADSTRTALNFPAGKNSSSAARAKIEASGSRRALLAQAGIK